MLHSVMCRGYASCEYLRRFRYSPTHLAVSLSDEIPFPVPPGSFSVRPFKIHPVYFRMAFAFDPAGFCLQEVHLSDVLLAPRMDEASAELFYCENNIETIVYTIQQPGRESEDWTRYRDQRSVTDQIDNVVRLIQMEMVTDKIIVKAGSAPHAFCCTTDDARKKVRHPKIVLQCCPTECNVKKEGDVGLRELETLSSDERGPHL